jgi:hypothetical protein
VKLLLNNVGTAYLLREKSTVPISQQKPIDITNSTCSKKTQVSFKTLSQGMISRLDSNPVGVLEYIGLSRGVVLPSFNAPSNYSRCCPLTGAPGMCVAN